MTRGKVADNFTLIHRSMSLSMRAIVCFLETTALSCSNIINNSQSPCYIEHWWNFSFSSCITYITVTTGGDCFMVVTDTAGLSQANNGE